MWLNLNDYTILYHIIFIVIEDLEEIYTKDPLYVYKNLTKKASGIVYFSQ